MGRRHFGTDAVDGEIEHGWGGFRQCARYCQHRDDPPKGVVTYVRNVYKETITGHGWVVRKNSSMCGLAWQYGLIARQTHGKWDGGRTLAVTLTVKAARLLQLGDEWEALRFLGGVGSQVVKEEPGAADLHPQGR